MIKRGYIYYADLGNGKGSEQSGMRPVLILQNDTGNKFSPTTIVAPLTTQAKTRVPTHVGITMPDGQKSIVLLEQIRVIDKSRISGEPVGKMHSMENIDRAARISLGLAETTD